MRRILSISIVAAIAAAPLAAQERAVEMHVYLEHQDGPSRTVSEARALRRGDRVVTVLDWTAGRPGATLTSAVPAHLSFLDSSDDALEISTDGGRNWQQLADSAGGTVTHLRWRAPAGRGRLAYSAIVR